MNERYFKKLTTTEIDRAPHASFTDLTQIANSDISYIVKSDDEFYQAFFYKMGIPFATEFSIANKADYMLDMQSTEFAQETLKNIL